jgi:flagellar protein FlaI
LEISHHQEENLMTDITLKDFYQVTPPFGNVAIRQIGGVTTYEVIEPTLTEKETKSLDQLKSLLIEELSIPMDIVKGYEEVASYIEKGAKNISKDYKIKVTDEAFDKLLYYLKRDFLGYGKVDVMIKDPNIEDISCDGVNIPIYVWHRNFESIPSNVSFSTKQELASFIVRLAYRSGGQITVSKPILEGTLPEGYRTHLTLDEVSKRGPTFTVRKFMSEPLTVVDLLSSNVLNAKMAAYLWLAIENLRSIMIVGPTASGKTTTLGAISMFIKPEMKIVSIEEIREVKLPHQNWIPMVTRTSFQSGVQEVSLFELLKSALRQRPDYIIVGEARGEEAYTLFQAISVGHGGLATIHADSISTAVKRLLTKPMDIPPILVPLMNIVLLMGRVKVGEKIARRIVNVGEILSVNPSTQAASINSLFEWTGDLKDTFEIKTQSFIFKQIAEYKHIPEEDLYKELDNRELILKWMVERRITRYAEVAEIIREYYYNPTEIFNIARLGEEWRGGAAKS